MIAKQMDAASIPTQEPNGSVVTHPSLRAEPPRAGENTVAEPPATALEALIPWRPVSYYILVGVSALALFAISMFLTILVLS